jgi:acyl-CoA synthetase (AMP-forming)/AMP-acid ligase II
VARPRDDDETVVQALESRAEAGPETAIWFESIDAPPTSISCVDLLDRTRLTARRLMAHGVRPGDRVVIVLPTGRDFPLVFYGILAAGGVAVPIYPPASQAQIPEFLRSLRRVLLLTGSRTVVTIDFLADLMAEDQEIAANTDVVTTTALAERETTDPLPVPGPSDLALIQFSSGSTGDPKGICLSHRNIVANVHAFQRRMDVVESQDVVVSWLPLYHDMGLIGTMIGSVVTRIPLVLASPIDFLRGPSLWFRLLSEYRVTIAVAPQFALNLCLRRVAPESLEGLDLSSLRVLLNGAEPVHADSIREFEQTYAPLGLRRGVVTPCYGLAEHTLAVTMGRYGEEPRVRLVPGERIRTATAVSSGRPIAGTTVAIIGDRGERLPELTVGEIAVRSASVGHGMLTEAGMTPLTDDDGWLRTGDLGFLAEGELYVVGRTKDLILAAGRNLHPVDLERAASTVSGVRPGRVIAFAVDDEVLGTQAVVVAAETRLRAADDLVRCAAEIRGRLLGGFAIAPRDVVLLTAGHIPLTSSGKPRRHRLKEAYERGAVDGVRYSLRPAGGTAVR